MDILHQAIIFAVLMHTQQRDKNGEPYILHPLRVMLTFESEDYRVAAVLHDVVEDTGVTLEGLRWLPENIWDAVDALTRRGAGDVGEHYFDYIRRCRENTIGRMVKIADIEDNLIPERIVALGASEGEGMRRRYAKALSMLGEVGE